MLRQLPQLLAEVRRALVLRAMLGELAAWAAVLGTLALAVALAMPSWPRWPLLAVLGLAPIVGLVRARRTRPSDSDLVLWIDRRLGAGESVITAWELGDRASPVLAATIARASEHLARATPRAVRPRIVRGDACALPIAGATFLAALAVPVPPPPPRAPGSDVVRSGDSEVLRRIERLPELAREPEQRRELDDAARRARALRRDLEQGLPRREALDRLEGVRLAVEAARPRATSEQRRAQDAAAEAMEREPGMQRATQERDLEALDREVERAAARREAADRERARQALHDGAEAARRAGDEALAGSLLEREELLERRAEQAALARELAEAMPELAGLERALDRLERDGEGEALNRAMVDATREAWARLSEEERQRLADAMRRAPVAPSARAEGETSNARGEPMSADEIEQQLRDALANLEELQVQLGERGMATPGAGRAAGAGGRRDGSGSGSGNAGRGNGTGAGGPGEGGAHADSAGSTRDLGVHDGPLARVRPQLGAGAPSRSSVEWIDPAGMSAPDSARGSATGEITGGEQGAIERLPIPEDYREHVREYFDDQQRSAE